MPIRLQQAVLSLLLPLLISSRSSAFETHLYTTKQCSGMPTSSNLTVGDGCQSFRGGTVSGMINKWADEKDNKLILATYKESDCCHANLIQIIDWADGCIQLQSGPDSWRVLDPDQPEKGKEGEDYNSCSK